MKLNFPLIALRTQHSNSPAWKVRHKWLILDDHSYDAQAMEKIGTNYVN